MSNHSYLSAFADRFDRFLSAFADRFDCFLSAFADRFHRFLSAFADRFLLTISCEEWLDRKPGKMALRAIFENTLRFQTFSELFSAPLLDADDRANVKLNRGRTTLKSHGFVFLIL